MHLRLKIAGALAPPSPPPLPPSITSHPRPAGLRQFVDLGHVGLRRGSRSSASFSTARLHRLLLSASSHRPMTMSCAHLLPYPRSPLAHPPLSSFLFPRSITLSLPKAVTGLRSCKCQKYRVLMALNPLTEGRDSDGDSEDKEEDGGGGEMVKDAAPERWDVLGLGQAMLMMFVAYSVKKVSGIEFSLLMLVPWIPILLGGFFRCG
ncbi:uncharacterized protein A4U43_C07F24340 [Asparagus officinalis]|uniref:Uncharacterized protein n=1 Tax=Asparagus officinalis TaxID=4686 RepID=A0A5P1EEI7_ASPOF|nr:uncharacterized protein A4U43_C07F24340 [Asparagus officinalis]